MLVTFVDDHRFRAMGTDCHLQVVEGAPTACDVGEAIVRTDEARWSRFLPDSELSIINDRAGSTVAVSAETATLVQLAVDAQRATHGWFDPLLGEQVRAAGYDRSFDAISSLPAVISTLAAPTSSTPPTLVGDRGVAIPPSTRLDLGGIAKGHTADRVLAALIAHGAAGACVNIGGDLACGGASPDGSGWWCSIDHHPGWAVGLTHGGVATSTTTRRRWRTADGGEAHHLIDPTTGCPSSTTVRSATVVAADAATAEVLAKVVLLAPWDEAEKILAAHAAAAIASFAGGEHRTIGPVADLLFPIGDH